MFLFNSDDESTTDTLSVVNKRFQCPHCQKAFRVGFRLSEHVKMMHKGEFPLHSVHFQSALLVTTAYCRLLSASHHQVNGNTAADQLNESSDFSDLQCRACGSVFDTLGDLRRHENTCTRVSKAITGSVDRFCCNECGMIFVLASALRTHLSSVHESESPLPLFVLAFYPAAVSDFFLDPSLSALPLFTLHCHLANSVGTGTRVSSWYMIVEDD
ncbi:unnamed protein product [Dibothriocephalus latus]|uniref:C2H2-type domain-containing protein n=1 Tax=Dibothriocephalus latus TaxID=60516 RepID=A0A3P7P0H4_DIBLA|nr:unnamed protein product [Dibothriocephalus latus]